MYPHLDYKAEAARCRRLMREVDDPGVRSTLAELADYYERQVAFERDREARCLRPANG